MKPITIARAVGSVAGAGAVVLGAYRLIIRPWHLRWGATDADIARALPGDEEAPEATLVGNRVVTIEASPAEIWPWLVQIGKGRAGFYSYAWIEHLMGLEVGGAGSRILPEFQQLKAGDEIPGFFPVTAVEPGRYLLFAVHESWGDLSFVLVLQPRDEQQTRLIARSRYHLRMGELLRALPPQMALFYLLFEPGEFVMLRKMLLGIKQRAERSAQEERRQEQIRATMEGGRR